jgi:hypothetical protein
MDQTEKVRENRLRRMAHRQGKRLSRNPTRDPYATKFGMYSIDGVRDQRVGPTLSAPTVRRRRADSIAAEAAFRAHIAEQGAEVLEPGWLGSKKPHRVRCAQGHLCHPKPRKVMEGVRICTTCPGKKSAETERRFRAEVASQGGRVIGEYAGINERIACICAAGHPCTPLPTLVLGGGGVCPVCSGRCQVAAGDAFRAGIAAQGGSVIGDYVNAKTPVACICAAGHECKAWPEVVKRGDNMCRVCAGQDPQFAAEAFRGVIALRGGRVVGEYVNSQTPIECMCPRGHLCAPLPNNVQRGQGM